MVNWKSEKPYERETGVGMSDAGSFVGPAVWNVLYFLGILVGIALLALGFVLLILFIVKAWRANQPKDRKERCAVNAVQTVTIGGAPTGGTFTLTYLGQTTGSIEYSAKHPPSNPNWWH